MSGRVLALDPGLRNPAIAFGQGNILFHASRVRVPGKIADIEDYGERVAAITDLVLARACVVAGSLDFDVVVYERPQVYRTGKSKGDPNDLIPLAMLGGSVAGAIRRASSTPVLVRAPTPAMWINGTPKATTGPAWASPRGQFIRRRLSEIEALQVVESHDAIDAAGLFLYHAVDAAGNSRMMRRRVLPGAT